MYMTVITVDKVNDTSNNTFNILSCTHKNNTNSIKNI